VTAAPGEEAAPRRRPKDRKQQIILAARDLFVERGYASVSMALIAERLGITAGALYRHFDNKAVLLEEVFRESFGYLTTPVGGDSLEEVVDRALDVVVLHPYVSDLWESEVRYLADEARHQVRQDMRAWAHSFVPVVSGERPEIDEGQIELVVWGLQSVFAFVGSITTRVSTAARRPVVRRVALAAARADLVPTGEAVSASPPVVTQASTRERLLRAAVDQFVRRGYQDSSMASIGAAADVTGPNLYAYFESKADLLRAVQERAGHALWLHVDRAVRRATTHEEALGNLVAGHVQIANDWPHLRVELTGEHDVERANRAVQRDYVAEWVAVLREVRPDLDVQEARMRSLIAIKAINDLSHTPHVAMRTSFQDNVARMATAILLAPPEESAGTRSPRSRQLPK
jgi:AcrR family transcriptional regulator